MSRVNRHFEGGCIDFDHYSQALLGNEVESQLAHFRRKVEEAEPERVGSLPAQALVGLLARVARYDVALDLALTQFPHARSADVACPTAPELCRLARRFDRLEELAREQGDWLSYAAASLEARAADCRRRVGERRPEKTVRGHAANVLKDPSRAKK